MERKEERSGKRDLLERTFAFARDTRSLLRKIPRSISTIEDGQQLIRSSGSVGANYIEANEAISKKDYLYRLRICRKEAKESGFWLRLLTMDNHVELDHERLRLVSEAKQFILIFSSMISKSSDAPL